MYIHTRFEWEERKNRLNQRKHGGISFELAAGVFDDVHCTLTLDRIDDMASNDGTRWAPSRLRPGARSFCS